MGYLLKEALKTLCGVNQWAYAVFWKIGCQNPKLLIWEECYYETASCSGLNPINTLQCSSSGRSQDKVHLLVDKMMVDNHFNVVGEGLVGRAAFTGNHHWILSGNYFREQHPPEVLKDVCQQFAAGMQTILVVPALPHGVVQFGSFSTIAENPGFVNDVRSLVVELGYVSGALLSENFTSNEHNTRVGIPISLVNSTHPGSSSIKSNTNDDIPFYSDGFDYVDQTSMTIDDRISLPLNQSRSDTAKPKVIPSSSEMWIIPNSYAPPASTIDGHSRSSSQTEQKIFPEAGALSHFNPASRELKDVTFIKNSDPFTLVESNICGEEIDRIAIAACDLSHRLYDNRKSGVELKRKLGGEDDEVYVQPESRDDLFDVLGVDFKNKLFSRSGNNYSSDGSPPSALHYSDRITSPSKSQLSSEIYSDSGIFSSSGVDDLLEAVVTKIPPIIDDIASCRTAMTSNVSFHYNQFGVSDPMKQELFDIPKRVGKMGETSSCSLITKALKDESSSSIYGSQISSWIQKNEKMKPENTMSTGHSKKPETGKTMTRRRLKPGENPRPRPKDRQMIQDRVKELREIVPNGAKCSIDSLLERTIKHMLFLQSVAKHADKLKQTGESKIICKDGGLLMKDNFEGGATWAYEVGSQSMVCPIIVEDLNESRQMLIEMLCEERGLFLEIADIIRGLGLTILKGVMESRNGKIWARFAVEANRDVTRMEIFISLVRLLEQSSKQENTYHQASTSVPLPGRSQ
ncbi:transcription factor LHW-like [Andrographis paniculata]|uniref:transcription factor LHW-like n=1 Tax=Andrographis paniculata TaxID=175694 RepID=UPI0021E8520F|nr:transcription factor LHW-like [Andrographis paniculata]